MPEAMTDVRRAVLRALCDTVVPALSRAEDPGGFWGRKASDVGADLALEQALATFPPELQAGLHQLLDALAEQGFTEVSRLSREQLLRNVTLASRDAAAGVQALVGLTLYLAYGIPDPATGRNPFWSAFGYPGPISLPPDRPKAFETVVPEDGASELALEADVVVVGSGAGGGVVAAELARRGLDVVVLEAGGHYDEADFNQLELWAQQNLYWRGGPTPTADGNVTLQAGSCVGGGTVVNWTNCLRTKPWVRTQWATEHGLAGVDGPEFDAHLDAVWERLSVNDGCSELNRPQERMRLAAERLGWSFKLVTRNWDPALHDPAMAGYMGFGDQSGAKQSTLRTYLPDAVAHGARIVSGCWVDRIEVEPGSGRATGVTGVWSTRPEDPAGPRSVPVRVTAGQVVVAAGALESPAILLRSGIGGPAAGDYLRLHPCTATLADYGEDQQAWWGAPHAGLIDEFANAGGDGYGFLIEGAQYTTALGASAVPWTGGEEHKVAMSGFRNCGTMIGVIRDQGHGRVVLDADGTAQPTYALTHPADVANMQHAIEVQIRASHAAGAQRIVGLAAGMPEWRVGDDLDAYIARCTRMPLGPGGWALFAAHQMGSCRMGVDPATSVADPHGELHDTPGVWIGDASAFPTPSGTNPMITIMALARRTAGFVAEAAGAGTAGARMDTTADDLATA